jgi:putative membrane protein
MNNKLKAGICGAFLLLGAHSAFAADSEDFVDDATAKGIAEIEAGKSALQKGHSADVKTFAQMMIDDHTKANEKLKAIAAGKKLEVASDAELMDKAKKMLLDIRDDSFDRSYANNQVKAHEQTIAIFEEEAKDGKDAELKMFAHDTLPKLKAHLAEAKKLAAAHGGDAK